MTSVAIRYHFIRADKTVADVCTRFKASPGAATILTEHNEGKVFPRDASNIMMPPYDTWIWVDVWQDVEDDASWEWKPVIVPRPTLLSAYAEDLMKGPRVPAFPLNSPYEHQRLWLNYRNASLREAVLMRQGDPPPAHGDAALKQAIPTALLGGTGPADDIDPAKALLQQGEHLWAPFFRLQNRLVTAIPRSITEAPVDKEAPVKFVAPPDNFDKLCRMLVNIYGTCKWLERNKHRVDARHAKRTAEISICNLLHSLSGIVCQGKVAPLQQSLSELRDAAAKEYLVPPAKMEPDAFAEWQNQVKKLRKAMDDPELKTLIQWVDVNNKGGNRVFSLPWASHGSTSMSAFYSEVVHLAQVWLIESDHTTASVEAAERALNGIGTYAGKFADAPGPSALDYIMQVTNSLSSIAAASVGNTPGPATLTAGCIKLIAARRSFWAAMPDSSAVMDKLSVAVRKGLGTDAFDLMVKWQNNPAHRSAEPNPFIKTVDSPWYSRYNPSYQADKAKIDALEAIGGTFHTSPTWLKAVTLGSALGLISAVYADAQSSSDASRLQIGSGVLGTVNAARATLHAVYRVDAELTFFGKSLGPALGYASLAFGALSGVYAYVDAKSDNDTVAQVTAGLQFGGSALVMLGGALSPVTVWLGAGILVAGNVLLALGAAVALVKLVADLNKPGSARVFETYLLTFEQGDYQQFKGGSDVENKLKEVRRRMKDVSFEDFYDDDMTARAKLGKLNLPDEYVKEMFRVRPGKRGLPGADSGDALF